MRRMPARAVVALAALTLLTVTGCSTAAAASSRSDSPSGGGLLTAAPVALPTVPTPTPTTPIRVAVVGDSLSAGDTGDQSAGLNGNAWMTYAQGGRVQFAGGWAVAGTTVQEAAAHVTALPDVDVLVLMSGTNDVRLGLSLDSAKASYQKIVSTIKPKHVIIGALPPYDPNPTAALDYEAQLAAFAKTQGWTVFDPWTFGRDGDEWTSIYSADGVHPATYGYMKAGEAFRTAILKAAD